MYEQQSVDMSSKVAHADRGPFLSVSDVATMFDISVRKVWQLSSNPRDSFPEPVRIGKKTCRWRLSDLERYADNLKGAWS